jgi:hypothetical protein
VVGGKRTAIRKVRLIWLELYIIVPRTVSLGDLSFFQRAVFLFFIHLSSLTAKPRKSRTSLSVTSHARLIRHQSIAPHQNTHAHFKPAKMNNNGGYGGGNNNGGNMGGNNNGYGSNQQSGGYGQNDSYGSSNQSGNMGGGYNGGNNGGNMGGNGGYGSNQQSSSGYGQNGGNNGYGSNQQSSGYGQNGGNNSGYGGNNNGGNSGYNNNQGGNMNNNNQQGGGEDYLDKAFDKFEQLAGRKVRSTPVARHARDAEFLFCSFCLFMVIATDISYRQDTT